MFNSYGNMKFKCKIVFNELSWCIIVYNFLVFFDVFECLFFVGKIVKVIFFNLFLNCWIIGVNLVFNGL